MEHSAAVGQLVWKKNLNRIDIAGGKVLDEDRVSGKRWCTGTLISQNLFLTAAHCFLEGVLKLKLGGELKVLDPWVRAKLMTVSFNYQIDGQDIDGKRLRIEDRYPVVEMVEYGFSEVTREYDYAILKIGKNKEGHLPNDKYKPASIDTTISTLNSLSSITIIQHPNQHPKKIDSGSSVSPYDGKLIEYSDVDSENGSSGAGVLSQGGQLIGIHIQGGCRADGLGANKAIALNKIAKVSKVLPWRDD